MSNPAPSHADPIPLAATRSHRATCNTLIRGALELNLMPFGNYPIYRLAEDDDRRFALYMSTSIGAKDVPPHDHTTWAVIVSVQGTEENRFYEKVGDYSVPGKGQIRQCGGTTVRPGVGVCLM